MNIIYRISLIQMIFCILTLSGMQTSEKLIIEQELRTLHGVFSPNYALHNPQPVSISEKISDGLLLGCKTISWALIGIGARIDVAHYQKYHSFITPPYSSIGVVLLTTAYALKHYKNKKLSVT